MKKPKFTKHQVQELIKQTYELDAQSITQLPAFYDYNAKIVAAKKEYLLKVATTEKKQLAMQNKAMVFLNQKGITTNIPLPTKEGEYITQYQKYNVRLLTFIPGKMLSEQVWTDKLLQQVGKTLAKVTLALQTFSHPNAHRTYKWDLQQFPSIRKNILLAPKDIQPQLEQIFADFQKQVVPLQAHLPQGVIHNDLHQYNIIANEKEITGIIDFGDMLHTQLINELAINLSEMLTRKSTRNTVIKQVLAGYQQQRKLTEQEKQVLPYCIRARLVMLYINSLEELQLDPENKYVADFIDQARETLQWATIKQLQANIL